MKIAAIKLLACLAALPLSLLCVGLTSSGWFFLGFIVALPLSILYWKDLGTALRDSPDPRGWVRLLGVLMGVPQALFGLLCAVAGLAIVCWVLYNTLVERQAGYSGGFLAFGLGPALALFGISWVIGAFKRSQAVDEG